MRYVSSVKSNTREIEQYYLNMTNDIVNVNFGTLAKHPELQMLLMQVVGIGAQQFHQWIKPGKRTKNQNQKLFDFYSSLNPHLKDSDIELLLEMKSKDAIKNDMLNSGFTDKEIKDMLK
jgi:hypothetical protein